MKKKINELLKDIDSRFSNKYQVNVTYYSFVNFT